MEAESYLAGGYGIRLQIEGQRFGWLRLSDLAQVWQPSRLKGILVSPQFGTPFLAATQVFEARPTPRKFLALSKTSDAQQRFVDAGTILVTCSGAVGRTTLAYGPHIGVLISHDLLRVTPKDDTVNGWLYAFLRSEQARAIMTSAQYGHIVKHLEPHHLHELPIPLPAVPHLRKFQEWAAQVLSLRTRAYSLMLEAEEKFASAIGDVTPDENQEVGFSVVTSSIHTGRRRLEAAFHTPVVRAILARFSKVGRRVQRLRDVAERVWWETRFRRVFGEEGVPYFSADELFSLNPPVTKRVLVEQAENAENFFAEPGWLLMACSGQVYGLNGSVTMVTERHRDVFFSHDLIRITPDWNLIRPGYLLTALSHRRLGRPLVIRSAYGTSIPHLDPGDVADTPVVRLKQSIETAVADAMEESQSLFGEADTIENSSTDEATRLVGRYLSDDLTEFQDISRM